MTEKTSETKIFCAAGRNSLREYLKDLSVSHSGQEAWENLIGISFSCGRLLDNITVEDIGKVKVHHALRWEQYKEGFYPVIARKKMRPKNPLGMAFFAIDHIYSKKRG